MEWSTLQQPEGFSDENRLELVASSLKRYSDTRSVIPEGNLVEIKYRELVSDQAGTLKKVYSHLDLDMPDHMRAAPAEKYQRNKHPELTHGLKQRIREVYQPFIEAGLFDSGDFN